MMNADGGLDEPLDGGLLTGADDLSDEADGSVRDAAAADAEGLAGLDEFMSRDAAMELIDELEAAGDESGDQAEDENEPEENRHHSKRTKRRVETQAESEATDADPAKVERRAVIRTLRSLGPAIRACLKRGRMTDTRVVVRFNVKNDGSITYRGARPRPSWSTDRCIRRATNEKRTRTLTTGPMDLGFPYIATP